MPAQHTTAHGPPSVLERPPDNDEERVRELAIAQIERKRRFHARALGAAVVSVGLVIIWAIAEYHNAGGWPTSGFSQSSGIPHTWNSWIVYPLAAIALGVAIDAWHTYRHRPVTEDEIRREMDRLRGAR
jgi:protein-S-isoprenylcysteine O-methyltransferase Ste14